MRNVLLSSSVTKTKGGHLTSYCTRAAKLSSTTARHSLSLSRLSEEAQIRCEIGRSQNRQSKITLLLLQAFPYLGSSHRVFNLHVLRSYASSIFTPSTFVSFLITSLHLSFCLHIFRCEPTSIIHVLHQQSFSPHGLTISVSLLLFSDLCLPHLPLLLFLHS